jgi:hypothetical protein
LQQLHACLLLVPFSRVRSAWRGSALTPRKAFANDRAFL